MPRRLRAGASVGVTAPVNDRPPLSEGAGGAAADASDGSVDSESGDAGAVHSGSRLAGALATAADSARPKRRKKRAPASDDGIAMVMRKASLYVPIFLAGAMAMLSAGNSHFGTKESGEHLTWPDVWAGVPLSGVNPGRAAGGPSCVHGVGG